MPTFISIDERFDDIEYTIQHSASIQGWYWISFETANGDSHPSPRSYNKPPTEAEAIRELVTTMQYWRRQLHDRSNAAVCDRTHYRAHPDPRLLPGTVFGYWWERTTFRFRSLETGEELVSDAWFQSSIPVWAASAFPDTHERA